MFFVCTIALFLFGCYKETIIVVEANFNTAIVNNDESVPVLVTIDNLTENADSYVWTFEGAEPSTSYDENPGTVVYNNFGTYTITLEASNVDGSKDIFEKEISVVDAIDIIFSTEIIESDYPPVEIAITNNTDGEELTYLWTFEGGIPETSTAQHPENIIFNETGEHTITLEVSNGFETFSEQTTINVNKDIIADFDWDVNFFDDDYQAPVTINMNNYSTSATSYEWTFEGGTPTTSSEASPSVTFNNAGVFTISLTASNGKRTNTQTKEITIYEDTNIKTFNNVELGLNNAHNTSVKGAFFSTSLRKVFNASEVTDDNGAEIDIAFLGLNSNFSYNKFISPDEVSSNGFLAIPNATHTKFINSQENCDCSASLTIEQFDSITDDTLLKNLIIEETNNGLLAFDNTVVPRIVLFETQDGRKGAIKIKSFVKQGTSSYINCDIKVQKL